MATGLTKTALTRHLAEKLELTNKQSAAFLDLLAETAIKGNQEERRIRNSRHWTPGEGRAQRRASAATRRPARPSRSRPRQWSSSAWPRPPRT